eukprot:gene16827-20572_t
MFGAGRAQLIGQSFQVLYPSADEYERLGAHMEPILNAKGHYADNRIMKRANGEVFWCHVSGRALNRDAPHESGIWSFEDLSSQRPVKAELTGREREDISATSMLQKNKFLTVDPSIWTPSHARLIMLAASYPQVERVFVNPAIKKKLCDTWTGDRSVLGKIRPIYGHDAHFHIRM